MARRNRSSGRWGNPEDARKEGGEPQAGRQLSKEASRASCSVIRCSPADGSPPRREPLGQEHERRDCEGSPTAGGVKTWKREKAHEGIEPAPGCNSLERGRRIPGWSKALKSGFEVEATRLCRGGGSRGATARGNRTPTRRHGCPGRLTPWRVQEPCTRQRHETRP
jgi:hypothetical protein